MTRTTVLPVHPRTGLTALGIVAGRPVWPMFGADDTEGVIATLERRRTALVGEAQEVLAGMESAGRDTFLASERRRMDALNDQISIVSGRLAVEQERQARRAAVNGVNERLGLRVDNGGQPLTGGFGRGADTVYARGSGTSYFADLAALLQPATPGAYEAMQRLNDHGAMIERVGHELPAAFRSGPQKRGAHLEARVNPNRTDGQGGFFVPPLWIIEEWVALLRAGRALADRCNVQDLPGGTDVINLPKVATGTATAVQAADAGAVQSTDLTDTSLSAPVRTIAGQQDVALQLIEQSPGNFDEVVFGDLIADYNQKVDVQVISGTGASGQLKGILNVSGINAITYTDATPTVPELWVPLMQMLSQIAKTRFMPADTIGFHPSLWYWFCAALDTTNRPLVSPSAQQALNTLTIFDANAVQGVAGEAAGVPIVVDANLPLNLGAGTNESRIITGRYKDAYLWEGALRTRALPEVLSNTLQVRLQVYNYLAFMPDRYPTAFSVMSGTGLIPTAGF